MADYQDTPTVMSTFSRMMLQLYDERNVLPTCPQFFQSIFANPANGASTTFENDANQFEAQIIRAGNNYLAAMVPRNRRGQTMGSLESKDAGVRYTEVARTFPLAEETSYISIADVRKKQPGENAYNPRSQKDRLLWLAKQKKEEHARRFARLFEYLAAQSILYGQMPAIVGTTDTDLIFDWYRNSNVYKDKTAAKWTTIGTDVMGHMDEAWTLGKDYGKIEYDMCIMGADVAPGLFSNTAILALNDQRRVLLSTLGNVQDSVPANMKYYADKGLTYRGWVQTANGHMMHLFVYEESYHNSAGTKTYYLPATDVLFMSSKARADRLFGPPELWEPTRLEIMWYQDRFGLDISDPFLPPQVTNMQSVFQPAALTTDAYPSLDKKGITIQTQCAPVFIPTQTDAFCLYENCA